MKTQEIQGTKANQTSSVEDGFSPEEPDAIHIVEY